MAPPISRRTFLIGAATAVGAVACSKSNVINVNQAQVKDQLNLLVTSALFVSGVDTRVALVMKGQSDFVTPTAGPVTLEFGPDVKHLGPPEPAVVHTDAGNAPDYLTRTRRFDTPGTYWVRASYQGRTADAPLQVVDPQATQIPIIGRKAIVTPTPTTDDARGLNPICTRQPVCPWHALSLDTALGQGKPIALLFATPALCQTATCGPVLDTMLGFKDAYAGKVTFIHSEIYTDMTAKATAPAVNAYHLESEPMLFLIGADGVVKQRFDGLFGHAEAQDALSQLVS